MITVVRALDVLIAVLRPVFFAAAALLFVVAAMDWAVRTRRINPFSRTARFFRASVDPLIAPIERRIVRAGGMPSNAPWYALGAVVLGGIIILTLLSFVQGQLANAASAASMGGSQLVRLIVGWAFGFVKIALLVYVISSWVRISPYSPWVRWAYAICEPMLRPLRQVLPPIGGAIDLSPLVAYFILWVVEQFVMRAF